MTNAVILQEENYRYGNILPEEWPGYDATGRGRRSLALVGLFALPVALFHLLHQLEKIQDCHRLSLQSPINPIAAMRFCV